MAGSRDGITLARNPWLATALLTSVVLGGTIGYVGIEGWGAWDAFYMTVITVTTVGYREVHELSRAGQIFTVLLLLSGVGAALYTFTLVATMVVEGGLPKRLQWRWRVHMLETLTHHFIICGYGRIGGTVAEQLRREGVPLVIIDRDPVRCQVALDNGFVVLEADASREETLRRAGIERARGLIAVVGTDAENVYTVLSAHVLSPSLRIIGRAESDDAAHKLKRAGADRVISPYHIGAVQIARTALRPAVVDFVELATSSENLELAIEEIPVAAGSPLVNKSIVEASLRQRYGVIVVGIQRQDGTMQFNPEPGVAIRASDKLVVLGPPQALKRLESEALA